MEINTVSTYTSQPMENFDYAAFYVNIIIGSLGLIGNAFVCLVMLQYPSIFNSTTNKLIIHQSIVDFLGSFVFLLSLFLVVSPPSQVPDNIFGSLYCRLWWSEWTHYSMFTTSTYNLVAISIERYFSICQPFRHRYIFSNRLIKMMMAAAWICGWLSQTYVLPITHNMSGVCEVIWPSRTVQFIVALFIVYSATLILPLLIIVFCYTKIILELRKLSEARVGDNNDNERNVFTRVNKNVIKTLFLVAIFFVISWTPAAVNCVLFNLGLHNNYIDQTLNAIVVLNLCINPFIYCFTYERFQNQVKELLCGGHQRNVNRVENISGSPRQDPNAQQTV